MDDKTIPVTVLTGFLGAGKTTLLNSLGAAGGLADTLVVINEFGQVGLDHLLVVEARDDLVVELSNGCNCCTLHGDLTRALIREQDERKAKGRHPFTRVVMETSGVSDPSSIAKALALDPALSSRFHLEAIVTVVDAPRGLHDIAGYMEAAAQVALADLLIISKSGLVDPATVVALTRALEERNPFAKIIGVQGERIDPAEVFDADLSLRRPLLQLDELPGPAPLEFHGIGGSMLGKASAPGLDSKMHGGRYQVMSFHASEPIRREALEGWLVTVISLLGSQILRFKAIVDVKGQDAPIVLHGVQGVISPQTSLGAWPGEHRQTRMVFITEQLAKPIIQAGLEGFFPGAFSASPPMERAA